MFQSQFGTKIEDVVAAISITIFGSLILIILYLAKRFSDETIVDDDTPSTIKTFIETNPLPQSIREKRSLFLELTRLECRKITPIPECDEENCEEDDDDDNNENDDDEEEKDESEYYGRRLTINTNNNDIENNNYSISLNSTASLSQDEGQFILQRKRKLVFFTSSYTFNDDLSLLLLPSSSKLSPITPSSLPIAPIALVQPLPLIYSRQTDPPDIDLPDESYYLTT